MAESVLWKRRMGPVREKFMAQLASRPANTRHLWEPGVRPLAALVCNIAQEEMGWASSNFIPDDPYRVVFWSFDDGLDLEWAMMKISDKTGVEIDLSGVEISTYVDGTLGEFVATLAGRLPDGSSLVSEVQTS